MKKSKTIHTGEHCSIEVPEHLLPQTKHLVSFFVEHCERMSAGAEAMGQAAHCEAIQQSIVIFISFGMKLAARLATENNGLSREHFNELCLAAYDAVIKQREHEMMGGPPQEGELGN